jgi:catechol 2,3-dioxygenase-like lactoylglutathione lyase family enzyme
MDVLTSRTIIRATDLDRSLSFYRDGLGLAVAREFGEGSQRGVAFFAGGGLIEVVGPHRRPVTPDRHDRPGLSADGPVALWLQVRSLERAVAEVTGRGVALVRAPVLEPWGLVEAWVDDPDGLRIHLVEVPADHPLRRDQRDLVVGGGRL